MLATKLILSALSIIGGGYLSAWLISRLDADPPKWYELPTVLTILGLVSCAVILILVRISRIN